VVQKKAVVLCTMHPHAVGLHEWGSRRMFEEQKQVLHFVQDDNVLRDVEWVDEAVWFGGAGNYNCKGKGQYRGPSLRSRMTA
jgi:hypothetical protein